MQNNGKNFIIMCVLLGAAGLLSLDVYFKDFKQTDTVRINDFPRTVGAWTSQEIPLSKEELAILETDNAFVRRYKNPNGEQVYLYIVYSQTNHKVSHPPEICYIGSGVSVLEKRQDLIPVSYKNLTIATNRLLLEANNAYQISFYWFKVGDTFTANYWQQQALVAVNTLFGQRKGCALIRVSAYLINQDKEKAIKEVKEFTSLITPDLFKYLP